MGYLHYLKEKLAKAELIRQLHLAIVGASDTVGRFGHARRPEQGRYTMFCGSATNVRGEFRGLMETRYEHITLNEDHVPIITGTTMKVVELVVEQQAYGWSPEELHFQHPYLTLGQIHSALAYYWDHREELDRDIQRRLERVTELRRAAHPPPLTARLKDQGPR
jgi:uncharacterized protein (DUF433 family)